MAGGLFSLAKLFGITLRESANDGSDFTNPDADYRRLFLGEDGALHLKDSAGTVTDIGGSGSVATDAIWDAAGDLVQGTGANTAARLPLGTALQVLRVNAGATAAEWAAAAAGGITQSTVGTTAAGASFTTARAVFLKKVTLATAGLIQSIIAQVKGNAANAQFIGCAIYSDNAGVPANVIAVGGATVKDSDAGVLGNVILSTTVRAVTMPIGYWAVAGDYWLAVLLQAGADSRIQLAFTSGTGSDYTQASVSFRDHSVTATSSGTNDHSIAANILR